MKPSTPTVTVLCVTGESEDPDAVLDQLSLDGVTATAAPIEDGIERIEDRSIDCVFICESVDRDRSIEFVRAIRRKYGTLPVISFTGDGDQEFVRALFDAGVTEVIRSRAVDTPPTLVERRLETVLSAGNGRIGQRVVRQGQDLRGGDGAISRITEDSEDVVWVHSPDDEGFEYVSVAYEDVWGRPREKVYESHESLLAGIHPDDRERVRVAIQRQLEETERHDELFRVVRPDGDVRWVHSRSFGIREDGDLQRIVGIARDVTEHTTREQQLETDRDLVERILETSPIGLVVIDDAGEIVRVNDQAADLFGLTETFPESERSFMEGIRIYRPDGTLLDPDDFPFDRIEETGEPIRNEEFVVEKESGEELIISVDGVPLFENGSLTRVVLAFDDVTERVERETQLEAQRDELVLLDHINQVIRGVDESLLGANSYEEIMQAVCENLSESPRYRFALGVQLVGGDRLECSTWAGITDELVEEVFPIEDVPEESPGRRALESGEIQVIEDVTSARVLEPWIGVLQRVGVDSLAAIPITYDGNTYGVVAVYSGEEDAFTDRELDVLDELGGTVGYAMAAVESREREQTLTALYEATQDLLAAETEREVSEVVVDTAVDVLDLTGIGIFLFDDEENALQPVIASDELLSYYGDSTTFDPGADVSITWHTYVTGESQCYDDVRESEHVAHPETEARSGLYIPLGDHGVFVVASRDVGAFDEQKQQLVGLLAATTEAALDRVAGQADIRERDEELAKRTARLERLESALTLVRDVDRLIRAAGTRGELEESVCEHLVEDEHCVFAWIGRVPPDDDVIEPQTWAGVEGGYLDTVPLDVGSAEPAASTARSGEVTAVSTVTDLLREEAWTQEAVDRGYQSVLAIPIVYGDTTYGVLTVYANEPDTFTGPLRDVTVELGEALGYGINSVETKRGILAEQLTELELRIEGAGAFLNAVAEVTGEPVRYREISPEGDDVARVLFVLTDPPVPEILALESEFVAVDSLTHVERGDEHIFRATLIGQTVASVLLESGGIPQDVTASADETLATVRVPRELDVRVFLDRIRGSYPETELVSRRDVDRSTESRDSVRVTLEESLTDRQREVLVTAYESGFFQSPRETTGEELAELLDLSQPTVTHHLREAQRRLFASLLEDI